MKTQKSLHLGALITQEREIQMYIRTMSYMYVSTSPCCEMVNEHACPQEADTLATPSVRK